MPIYAYRCDACGHQKDVLQKMSDPTLTVCPSCGAESFAKQLSAPAFQLKGTGWYVTDFRDKANKANGGGKPAGDGAKAGEDKSGEDKADSHGCKVGCRIPHHGRRSQRGLIGASRPGFTLPFPPVRGPHAHHGASPAAWRTSHA